MLKWYADICKLSEKDMTVKALKRLKILTVLSLPAIPFVMARNFDVAWGSMGYPAIIIGGLSTLALIFLCLTKFMNRFWARDKYLDEWEVRRKHHAMALAFQSIACVVCLALIILMLSGIHDFGLLSGLEAVSRNMVEVLLFIVIVMMIYIPHTFLLFTVKPIDLEGDDLSISEVI